MYHKLSNDSWSSQIWIFSKRLGWILIMPNLEIFENVLSCMLLVLRKHLLRSVENKIVVVLDIWFDDFSKCTKHRKEITQICYLCKHEKCVDGFVFIVQWSFKYQVGCRFFQLERQKLVTVFQFILKNSIFPSISICSLYLPNGCSNCCTLKITLIDWKIKKTN